MVTKTFLAGFIIALVAVAAVAYYVGDYLGYQRGYTPSAFLEEIKNKGRIVVGTSTDYRPFEYWNATTQEIEGFDIEFVEAIGEQLGVTVEWKDMPFNILWAALESGTIDMIAAAALLTDERADRFEYSKTYYRTTQTLFVHTNSTIIINDIWDIGTLRISVGVQRATTGDDLLMKQVDAGNITESQIKRYDNADVIVQDVVKKQVDAGFIDKTPAVEIFSETYAIKIIFEVPGQPCVIFMPKVATDLRDEVDKIIEDLREDGTYADLVEKWFA